MKKYCNIILKGLFLPAMWCFVSACEKEHLQPDVPAGGQAEPLVYIHAMLDSDSVHYEGGVDSYIGEVTMTDSMNLYRYFNFYLYSELSTPVQPIPCFKIYINNLRLDLGVPENDLDSTIAAGSYSYQDYSSGFTPFAVTVEWFDSAGAKYTTAFATQTPLNSSFIITSVEDIVYQNKAYKKVEVLFECTLLRDNFIDTMQLTNGRATLLFGTN
jgi:hypothetical protein